MSGKTVKRILNFLAIIIDFTFEVHLQDMKFYFHVMVLNNNNFDEVATVKLSLS